MQITFYTVKLRVELNLTFNMNCINFVTASEVTYIQNYFNLLKYPICHEHKNRSTTIIE